MQKMRLIVKDFEEYRNHFSLWSTIYVQIGGLCYPHDGWTDATSSILAMWTDIIDRIMSDAAHSGELCFMDGAYTIQLTKQQDMSAYIKFLEPSGKLLFAETMDLMYFARQLLGAAEKMVQHYWGHMDSSQIKDVLHAAEHLRHTIKSVK